MNRLSRAPWLALLLALAVLPAERAQAAAQSPVVAAEQIWRAQAQQLDVRLLPEVLQQLGLGVAAGSDDVRRLQLALSGALRFTAPAGKLDAVVESGVDVQSAVVLTVGGRATTLSTLRLLPVPPESGVGVAFDLMDRHGAVWFKLRNAHQHLLDDHSIVELRNMGLLAGPALAALLGDARLDGTGLGIARLRAAVQQRASAPMQPSSCAVPQWPSPADPGDVALTALFGYQVMRSSQMDGSGGTDGQVVIAPSATLSNVGTRDMPWYTKYSGAFPPYGNDQHPFLVWSMYRMDGDGMLVQHARSGIKHAFFTINAGCSCGDGNILGLGCSDTYDAFTNDVPFDEPCPGYEACTLGPRLEIAPKQGVWGRCGSIYDPNCDGNPADTQPYGPYDHRLVARETDFDPALYPGSQQWLEGWYLVRDDGNIDNSMGSTTIRPVWIPTGGGGTWDLQANAGPFVAGPVIQRWLAASPAPLASRSTRLGTADGAVELAVRVTALAQGRYRYQYALMNLDFGRAVITGTALNPTVVRALGLNALRIAGAPAAVTLPRFADGDRSAVNDWVFTAGASQLQWTAPAGVHLAWGSLVSFSVETATAPKNGVVTLGIAEPGTPADLQLGTLVPGSELFSDGFED